MPKEENKNVDAAEVADFLKKQSPKVLIPTEDASKLIDLTESAEETTVVREDEDRVSIASDEMFSPELDTKDSILEWAKLYIPVEDIELTEQERSVFLRAALHDKPVKFSITVLNEAVITCRALSDYEIEVMYAALEYDRAAGLIESDADFFGRMQNYGVLMQVVEINGKVTDFLCIEKTGDSLLELKNRNAHVATLREMTYSRDTSAAQSALSRAALRMFSAKMKLALENLANADFWKPAVVD